MLQRLVQRREFVFHPAVVDVVAAARQQFHARDRLDQVVVRAQREALKAFEDSMKEDNYEKRKGFFKNLRDRFS